MHMHSFPSFIRLFLLLPVLFLVIMPDAAQARTWKAGQKVVIRAQNVNDGQPRFGLSFRVPKGMWVSSKRVKPVLRKRNTAYSLVVRRGKKRCYSRFIETAMPPSLMGKTFKKALRGNPYGYEYIAEGRGQSPSRWVQYQGIVEGKKQDLMYLISPAISGPEPLNPESKRRSYYGVSLTSTCIDARTAIRVLSAIHLYRLS